MLDLMVGHGVVSEHCLTEQQSKCSKSKTEFFEQLIDFSASVINLHSFRVTVNVHDHKTIISMLS